MSLADQIQNSFQQHKIPKFLIYAQKTKCVRINICQMNQMDLICLIKLFKSQINDVKEISINLTNDLKIFDQGQRHLKILDYNIIYQNIFFQQDQIYESDEIEIYDLYSKNEIYIQKREELIQTLINVVFQKLPDLTQIQVFALYGLENNITTEFKLQSNLQVLIIDSAKVQIKQVLSQFFQTTSLQSISVKNSMIGIEELCLLKKLVKKQNLIIKQEALHKSESLQKQSKKINSQFIEKIIQNTAFLGLSWLDLSLNQINNEICQLILLELANSLQITYLNLKQNNIALSRDVTTPSYDEFYEFSVITNQNIEKFNFNENIYEKICDRFILTQQQKDTFHNLAPSYQYLGIETENIILNYIGQISLIDNIISLFQNPIIQFVLKNKSILYLDNDKNISSIVGQVVDGNRKQYKEKIISSGKLNQQQLKKFDKDINYNIIIKNIFNPQKFVQQKLIQQYSLTESIYSVRINPTDQKNKEKTNYYKVREKTKNTRKGRFGMVKRKRNFKKKKIQNFKNKQSPNTDHIDNKENELYNIRLQLKELQDKHQQLILKNKQALKQTQITQINHQQLPRIEEPKIQLLENQELTDQSQQRPILQDSQNKIDGYLFQRVLQSATRALQIIHRDQKLAQVFFENNKQHIVDECEKLYNKLLVGSIQEQSITAILLNKFGNNIVFM